MPAASSNRTRRSSALSLSIELIIEFSMVVYAVLPMPVSRNMVWMSRRRHGTLLMRYSLSPLRNILRVMAISLNSEGRIFLVFSIVNVTSAMLSADRFCEPEKITSCMFALRKADGFCSPNTHRIASITLLLPHPLGPRTAVTPSPNSTSVLSAKDLNPKIESLRNTMIAASFFKRVSW